jgi:branched-chain amino acid transport system permease protein
MTRPRDGETFAQDPAMSVGVVEELPGLPVVRQDDHGARRRSILERFHVRGASRHASLILLFAFALLGPSFLGSSRYFPYLVLAGIFGIAVVGVSLLIGLAGQVTFGQSALVGTGAYVTAIATTRWQVPPMAGVGLAVAVTVVIALPTSVLLRLQGWYFAMATVGMALIFTDVVKNLTDLTGGVGGIYGIPELRMGPFNSYDLSDVFRVAWIAVALLALIGRNLSMSRFGRAMRAIRSDEEAAKTLGVPAFRYKVFLWLFAAAAAGLSGALFAHYSAFIGPDNFSFTLAILLATPVFLAGPRSVIGAVVALMFLTSLPVLPLPGYATPELITGIALVIVYIVSPSGAAGLIEVARHTATRRRHA